MGKLTDILRLYSTGEATLEEVNKKLEENDLGEFKLDPNRCNFTKEQVAEGWGLLYTGTGYPDPARMVNGELVTGDCVEGDFYHDGKHYTVKGTKLTEV